jgi:hypothetical protein
VLFRSGSGNVTVQKQLQEQQKQIDALATAAEAGGSGKAVQFGGYGELTYNNLWADDSSNDLKEIDLSRFVLFTGYKFSDDLRFASEVEIEHVVASDGANGEVEVEQAFLEYQVNPWLSARSGVMLVPAGILNETHEPTTFYGVERNDVESVIIPTTWWAGGVGATAEVMPGLKWDLVAHEGLKVPTLGGTAFSVRAGRQKTSQADAGDFAGTTRLRYTAIPGLEVAASLQYQSDISQVGGDGLGDALLYTGHVVYSKGPYGLRALYAGWTVNGDAAKQADADQLSGWFVEPSYRVIDPLGIYLRYEDVSGALASERFTQWEGGVSFFLHPQVVLKADFRSRSLDRKSQQGRDFNGFDLGVGYNF